MKRLLLVTAAVVAAVGCEKKNSEAPLAPFFATGDTGGGKAAEGSAAPTASDPPKPRFGDTAPLWALAPADATLGFVVADGAGARVLATWAGSMKKLTSKPFAKKIVAELDRTKSNLGFDMFDESAYKAKGFDLTKGLAVFATADLQKPALLVLPVGDREALRKTVKATVEKVGDREVDKMEDAVCTVAGARYVCAPTLEQVDAAIVPHDSPLATAVKALPADSRGDGELYIDAGKMPAIKAKLAELKALGEFDTIGGALRIDPTSAHIVGWAKGTMGPVGQMLVSTAPPAELAGLTAGATSVLRLKLDPKLLAAAGAPPTMTGPDGKTVSPAALVTGDVQIVTAGKGLFAGAIFVKLTDPTAAKPLVAAICAEVKKGGTLPISAVVAKEDSCSGEISLAAAKDSLGVELPPFKFNFAVSGNLFAVVLGDLDLASLRGSVADEAGSPEARDALAGPQTAVLWSRNFGVDTSVLPKDLQDKLNAQPDAADGFNMMNWSASQAYDFAASFNVTSNGVKIVLHATTFEADPSEARAALDAAFDKRAAGDRAAFLAALGDIEKKFPGTLAARRAKLERVGTPVVGPILGAAIGVAAGAALFLKSSGAGVPTPTGGGFGQPGVVPVAPGDDQPAHDPPPDEKH